MRRTNETVVEGWESRSFIEWKGGRGVGENPKVQFQEALLSSRRKAEKLWF